MSAPKLKTGVRWPGILGAVSAVFLLGGGTWWAAETQIAGAVIATGAVEVSGRPKAVQHLDGGIISALHVRDGDMVEQGASLMTLDDTALLANLAIYRARLSEALATRDRLIAEQTDAPGITFAEIDPLVDPDAARLHRAGQREIFSARRALEAGRRERAGRKDRPVRQPDRRRRSAHRGQEPADGLYRRGNHRH